MPVKVDGVQTFRFQKHFSKLDGREEFITYFKYNLINRIKLVAIIYTNCTSERYGKDLTISEIERSAVEAM